MELLSVISARAIHLMEVSALDPSGAVTFPEMVHLLQKRFNFSGLPTTASANKDDEGTTLFQHGRMNDIAIDKLTFFPNGLVVETRSTTRDAEAVIAEVVDMARSQLRSRVHVVRKQVVSQVTFHSNMDIAKMNPVLSEIREAIIEATHAGIRQRVAADVNQISIGFDPSQIKNPPSSFSVERRLNAAYFENIFFSTAPLHTELHIELLEKLEGSLQ